MQTYLKGRLDGFADVTTLATTVSKASASVSRRPTAQSEVVTLSDVKSVLTPHQHALLIAGFYNIMYVNEYLDSMLVEFAGKLQSDTRLFRHGVRHWWNELRKTKRKYTDKLSYIMKTDMDEFCEQADSFWERMHPDFQILYYTVRREFLKVFPDDKVDMLTWMFAIGHTFTIARQNYYNWRCYYKREAPIIFTQPGFYSLDITEWVNRWNRMMEDVCHELKINEKLVTLDDTMINDALKIFEAKITSTAYTIEAIKSTDPNPNDVDLTLDIPLHPPYTPIPERYTNWTRTPV